MHVASKLLSQIFEYLKILKIEKIINKIYYFKKMRKISEFSKNGIHVKEPCQVYRCTKCQVDILKNARVFCVLKVENDHFSPYFPPRPKFPVWHFLDLH